MNIALLRLVEYLGYPNILISNLAFEELQRLSLHSSASALRLLEPYWRTIAVTVVKDLNKRPQMCQSLCDLLGTDVPGFLRLTQFHTIPYLILTRNKTALQRIAEANEAGLSITRICLEPIQIANILSYLLAQQLPDPTTTIPSLFSEVSPDFSETTLPDLLRLEPSRIASELLKGAGDQGDSSRSCARQALKLLAENTPRRSSSSRSSSKKPRALATFFEEGSLGIMQQLSDVVSGVGGHRPTSERRRSIQAIQEMIIMAKSHLINALPQVRFLPICSTWHDLNFTLGLFVPSICY